MLRIVQCATGVLFVDDTKSVADTLLGEFTGQPFVAIGGMHDTPPVLCCLPISARWPLLMVVAPPHIRARPSALTQVPVTNFAKNNGWDRRAPLLALSAT